MNNNQKEICDEFIYIPQFGSGTASLNVNVATSIIINEYNNWKINKNVNNDNNSNNSNNIYNNNDNN